MNNICVQEYIMFLDIILICSLNLKKFFFFFLLRIFILSVQYSSLRYTAYLCLTTQVTWCFESRKSRLKNILNCQKREVQDQKFVPRSKCETLHQE